MILATGATGNIGSALLRELHAYGAGPLRGLTRDASRVAFPEGVETVEGDLAVPESSRWFSIRVGGRQPARPSRPADRP